MKRSVAKVICTLLALPILLSPIEGATAQAVSFGVESTLSARLHTACAVTEQGSVICWGDNQIEFNNTPANMGRVVQVSVGDEHVCAVTEDGVAKCWGSNRVGQTNVPIDLGKVIQISSGGVHTCAITSSGLVRCWGYQSDGRTIAPTKKMIQISSGNYNTCGVTEMGEAICWGENSYGSSTVPAGLGKVQRVAAGDRYSCAVTDAKLLQCWGWDWYAPIPNDLGMVTDVDISSLHMCAIRVGSAVVCWDGDGYDSNIPASLGTVTQIADGVGYSCSVDLEQRVKCWGESIYDQINVPGQSGKAIQFSTGWTHNCALTELSVVRCWGGNDLGQLDVPSDLEGLIAISSGRGVTCGIAGSGNVRCWGFEGVAQTLVPSDLGAVLEVSTGEGNTCAVTTGNNVVCWGWNGAGVNNVPEYLGTVTHVSVGVEHSCALNTDGDVKCWGSNLYNQTNVPSNLGTVTQISAGDNHTCSLNTDGDVECWGSNSLWSGQPSGQITVPNDLGGVTQLSSGGAHTCVVTESKGVRCWGWNRDGQTTVPSNLGQVKYLDTGEVNTCAMTVNDEFRCWGDGSYALDQVPLDVGSQIAVLPLLPALSPTATPPIEGIPVVGASLSVGEPIWGQDIFYSYKWYRDGEEIAGADSRFYELVEDDSEKYVTVRIQGSKDGFKSSAVFTYPVSISKVRIQGEASLGSKIVALPGNWAQNDEYDFQWFIDSSPIENIEDSEYQVQLDDLGKTIYVTVTGTSYSGQVYTAQSNEVTVSLAVKNTECRGSVDTSDWSKSLQSTPVISGNPAFGQTLFGLAGNWAVASKCTYWLRRNGEAISGSDSSSYKIQAKDIGEEIRYVVVGSDKRGNTWLRYSKSVSIRKATFASSAKLMPTVKGDIRVGSRLTSSVTSWLTGTSFEFQWLRDGAVVPNANSSSYLLSANDLGKKISLQVCGSKLYFETLCLANVPKAKVALGVIPSQPKSTIASKTLKVGSKLTGNTGKWSAGVSLQSRWLVNGKLINKSENTFSYTIKSGDKGKVISFQIIASKAGYAKAYQTSLGKKIPK